MVTKFFKKHLRNSQVHALFAAVLTDLSFGLIEGNPDRIGAVGVEKRGGLFSI